jgi:hypothetical protein
VDFDHSLFLGNSTEAFLGSARPAFLATFLLKLLALLRPWWLLSRDRGYFVWRDAIRVWTIIVLMPWTLLLFRRGAADLFRRDLNTALAEVLQGSKGDELVIVSFGYAFVIRWLIAGSPFAGATLVATSLRHPARLRRQGKLACIRANAIPSNSATDIVITDSAEDDADLLGAFEHAFHVRWPDEKQHGAHQGVYIPFYYLATIKRSPGFFLKSTLLEEYPIFVLAFLLYQPLQWQIVVSGTLLFVAFLVVYEIGYHENDHIGARYEKAPKLSEAFQRQRAYRVEPYAWYWLIGLTAAAVAVLDAQQVAQMVARLGVTQEHGVVAGQLTLAAAWIVVALFVRLTFFVFNHVPLLWRVFVFFPLHLLKYFAPVVIFPLHPAGFALLGAQVIRTWSVYAIRRSGGDVEFVVSQLIRLMFLGFLLVGFALCTSFESLFGAWQTWLILGWCVARAIPEMKRKLFHTDVLDEFVPWSGARKGGTE